ncbi:MAG: NAD(P)/FAD-dependent oxidoreductase [Nostocaceae cyanobacterium]|nr:NAD(P)/FAD-dependent oxidoreductase [Nostocaceae cyanobacterium]
MTSNGLNTQVFDAIVIGGGPAGSSAAYKLAAEGRSVLLLEKSKFPRFHIGESMVPYLFKLLEMMGVSEKVKQGAFVQKNGVEFLTGQTNDLRRQNFGNLKEGQTPYSYNFNRARFDKILLDHARDTGAKVLQEADVKKLIFENDRLVGVEYQYQGQRYEARASYVVDASGRAGLVAKHFNLRKMNTRLENVAIFQHYENVVPENNPGVQGDVLFSCHEDGWLWGIPVETDVMSIGTVMPLRLLKQSNPEEMFAKHLDRSPRIKRAIKGATPAFDKPKVELDFCYYSEKMTGPGYFIVGDAACFVDPVFSGGVFLSMLCGLKAGEGINSILQGKDEKQAFTDFENLAKTGYDSYFRVVYCYYYLYNRDMNRMGSDLPGGFRFVLQTFAGDFWADKEQPVMQYLRSKNEWNTFEEPFERVYDCPVYPDIHYTADELATLPPAADFASVDVDKQLVLA